MEIEKLLMEYSTQKHYIEYDTFLSNHLSHGLIALHQLGASKDRLQRFVDWYIPRLEKPEAEQDDAPDFEDLKGKRIAFYKILAHYKKLLAEDYGSDLEKLIGAEYPKVSDGLAGSALHGSVHLGYGYSAKSPMLVLEGLAYVYHSHKPIVLSDAFAVESNFGKGENDILETLAALADNTGLREAMLSGVNDEQFSSLKVGIFQKRVAFLVTMKGDLLNSYVEQIKIPESCIEGGMISSNSLMKTVVIWAITAYASASAKNDFFLLHGVTCSYAINQFISLLSHDDGIKVIREFLTVLLAVYVAQNSPALTEAIGTDTDISAAGWAAVVSRCLAEDRDEHCYKLVQVCRCMAQQCPEFAHTCMQAALNSLDYKFTYTTSDQ